MRNVIKSIGTLFGKSEPQQQQTVGSFAFPKPKTLVERYLHGIEQAYASKNINFFHTVHGAKTKDLELLSQTCPDIPPALLEILSHVDGTNHRSYNDEKITFYMFCGYLPYYLNSSEQMIESLRGNSLMGDSSLAYIYGDEGIEDIAGPGIDSEAPFTERLHLAECMNNGGSSNLYIDFAPAPGGTLGQVICFTHDPDEYRVIAKSFDEFLTQQIEEGFAYIENDDRLDSYVKKIEELNRLQPFYERLKNNDPESLAELSENLGRWHILNVAAKVPSSGVLRIYLAEMRRLFAIRDEETPQGYKHGDQFEYLLRNFYDLEKYWSEDPKLLEEVFIFAKHVRDPKLLALRHKNSGDEALSKELEQGYTRPNVQARSMAWVTAFKT